MSHRLSKTTQTECTSWSDRRSYLDGGLCNGISDMCRDHRCLTTSQKQHRENEPAGQEEIPTRVEVCVMGLLDMCRDHGRFTACQKQHRQNGAAFRVNISNGVEICVMGDPRHM